jgi:hypothetical protein
MRAKPDLIAPCYLQEYTTDSQCPVLVQIRNSGDPKADKVLIEKRLFKKPASEIGFLN